MDQRALLGRIQRDVNGLLLRASGDPALALFCWTRISKAWVCINLFLVQQSLAVCVCVFVIFNIELCET